MPNESPSELFLLKTQFPVLFLIGLLFFGFAFQGSRGVWETSEGRYVAVASEMIRSGNWLEPALGPDEPHWTKPPLTYWGLASSILVFGRNDFAVRFPGAVAFIVSCLLVAAMGRVLVPQTPWLPFLIYGSFLFTAGASNVVTTDPLLSMFETAAMACFCYVYFSESVFWKRYGAYLGWCFLGLAFFTKGPPALVLLVAILIFHGIHGRKISVSLRWVSGSGLLLAIGGWWFLLMIFRHPDLLSYWFRDELVMRIASSHHHRNPEWYGGFKVYLPTLMLGTLPWTIPVWRAVRLKINAWIHSRRIGKEGLDAESFFLLLMMGVPVVIFFLVRSRLPLYVLPVFAPLALIGARGLSPASLYRKYAVHIAAGAAVLIILLRVISGMISWEADNRSFARQIRAAVPDISGTLVFVDLSPFQGVALYLDIRTERVWATAKKKHPETLEQKLSGKDANRVVWLIPETLKALFLLKAANAGLSVSRSGTVTYENQKAFVFLFNKL